MSSQSFDITPELLQDYVRETSDILDQLDAGLMRLDREPDSRDALNDVFRGFHSIKGTSGFLSLRCMIDVAHAAEDVLALPRDSKARLTPDALDALFAARDSLQALLAEIARGELEPQTPIADVLALLERNAAEMRRRGDGGGSGVGGAERNLRAFGAVLAQRLDETERALERLSEAPTDLTAGGAVRDALAWVAAEADRLDCGSLSQLAVAAHAVFEAADGAAKYLVADDVDSLFVALHYLRTIASEIASGRSDSTTDISGVLHLLWRGEAAQAPPPPTPDGSVHPVVIPPEPREGLLRVPPAPPPPAPTAAPPPAPHPVDTDTTVRLDVRRLDTLLRLVGELVLERNRLSGTAARIRRALPDRALSDRLFSEISGLSLVSSELQTAVLHTRMLPLSRAFSRLPRIVRDSARDAGKDVILDIRGEDTELDRALIEEITDPLVHLVRNAVDHGIESPDERLRAGKPRVGHIRIHAFHEGNRAVIAIEDDGGGIDPARVRARAVELGRLEPQAKVDDRDALDLIFQPGFSTRTAATALSGRGVGLDVVRTNIQRLNGVIEVDTTVGQGTRFAIKVPLTLAVLHVMLVTVGGHPYAIPTPAILECLRVPARAVVDADGIASVPVRDESVPVLNLRTYFGTADANGVAGAYRHLVVLAAADRRAGLFVDRFHGQQEVIVKGLGPHVRGARGLGGAAILDDGRVALVLDVAALVAQANRDTRVPAAGAAEA